MPSFHGFIIFSNNAKVMHEDKDGRRSVYFNTVKYDPKDDEKNKEFYMRGSIMVKNKTVRQDPRTDG